MGNIYASASSLVTRCSRRPAKRILIVGIDAAGKTSLLYRLKLGEVVTTIPTIGFNVETLDASFDNKRIQINAWDIGTRDKMRPLLRHYLQNTDAFVCVVDHTDVERLPEVDELLNYLRSEDVDSMPFLFLLNKQDLKKETVVTETMIRELKFVQEMQKKRHIGVLPTSATSGDGLNEAMEWIVRAMLEKVEQTTTTTTTNETTTKALTKPEIGYRWLIEAGKRALCFGG